jgi:predicted PurR-regulated permease PerM
VIALLFLAFIIAAAMRPGVDALHRFRIPRGAGILIHYAALIGLLSLLLWLVVPRAIDQVREALGQENLRRETEQAEGWKREVLVGVQDRLEELPSARELVDPAVEATVIGFEIFIGIFFVLACAAYWIYER